MIGIKYVGRTACAYMFTFSSLVGLIPLAQASSCGPYPIAPRTVNAPASQYASSGKFGLDEEGILTFDYGVAYDGLGKFRNPYFISNYANALYRDYLDSNCVEEDFKDKFLKQADYLVQSAVHKDGMALWQYPFKNDHFDLSPGWISGIGQARIASILMRAYGFTQNEKYRKIALEGMETYRRTLKEGGVITMDGDATWIEEAPSNDGHSFKILNGHITALSGILDFGELTQDPQWDELVRRGIVAVKQSLPQFDTGFTSYYSLGQPGADRMIAPPGDYNALHVHQLLWLYDLTGDASFLKWASRFQAYEINKFQYSAKGSVDPVRHGPDQAGGLYGSRYWSRSDFPTWIQVDLPKKELIKGFWIDANGLKPSPRDLSIDAYIDGEWKEMSRVADNASQRQVLYWDQPVVTDQIRLNIFQDNGNKNVALQAAMPIFAKPQYTAITNSCNYRISSGFVYNINAVIDGDQKTSMRVYCPGWVILPNFEGNNILSLVGDFKEGAHITVEHSTSMINWTRLGSFSESELERIHIPKRNFIKLTFGDDVNSISEIQLDRRR